MGKLIMIKRAALLIGVPGIEGKKGFLTGVKPDMRKIKGHLLSPIGGLWNHSEIHELNNPTKEQVRCMHAQLIAEGIDYLITFVGSHGFHYEIENNSYVELAADNVMSEIELIPSAIRRQTLVLDACRRFDTHTFSAESLDTIMEKESSDFSRYRQEFDRALERTEYGRIVLYSCSVNETADDPLFTSALVNEAVRWSKNINSNNSDAFMVLDIHDAFELARVITLNKNSQQHPEISAVRRKCYFPFALA